jgi:TolB-like protein/class 3 adenylate cyclase
MVQERPVRVERRLSAILAADVAGYSRLMHREEETTHVRLAALLVEVVKPAIAEHGGRIVKNTGDGFLAEFPSAVEAVRAAVQFQSRIHELTIDEAEDNRIALRVGVNIGDVIVEPHDIFGDGVNVAARLESIAEPGGICISSSVYDQVRGKVEVEFTDLGEQNLKNIALPVRAYAVVRERPSSTMDGERASVGTPSRPHLSIVVLPFSNISDNPEQNYFVEGVTESLTTNLARMRDAFVISRNSAFSYKGKAIDVRQVGRELNVRYVLEGSVQRSGDRLRVNVQLIDAESAKHLWAEHFDRPVANFFDLQDEILSRLSESLRRELIVAEAGRAEGSLRLDPMDLIFQGRACFYKGDPQNIVRARGFFERALAIDDRSVRALIGMAQVDLERGYTLLTDDPVACFSAAETNVIKALSLAPNDASAHGTLGAVYLLTNRAAQGIAECEHALRLDRNLVGLHFSIGVAKMLLGEPAETERHVLEALRLSPRDTFTHEWMLAVGLAKLMLGTDAEAIGWLRRSIETNRNYPTAHLVLAGALALGGALDEARTIAKAGLTLNPSFTVRRFLVSAFSDNPTYLAGWKRLGESMRLAGVPEG